MNKDKLWDTCQDFIKDNRVYDKYQTSFYFNKQLAETYEKFIFEIAEIVGYADPPKGQDLDENLT